MERPRKDDTGTRVLRVLRDMLVVGGLIAATYPWTSGAYTWLAQRRLAADLASTPAGERQERAVAPTTTKRAPTPSPFAGRLRGWDAQDAAYWRRLPEGGAFARLLVPKAGIDVTVVKGVREADLRRGPGWLPTTAMPGATGNVGISGHRTTFLAPFREIDRLEAGDTITLTSRWRKYTYRMIDRLFVNPDDTDVFAPTPEPMLTLTACHPPYSFQYRIVIRARLVDVGTR